MILKDHFEIMVRVNIDTAFNNKVALCEGHAFTTTWPQFITTTTSLGLFPPIRPPLIHRLIICSAKKQTSQVKKKIPAVPLQMTSCVIKQLQLM